MKRWNVMRAAAIGALCSLYVGGTGAAPAGVSLTATTPVHFDVYLPLQNGAALDQLLLDLHNPQSPKYQQWLTPEQFLAKFGASQSDMAKVSAALTARGFQVLSTDSHGLHVAGTAAVVNAQFHTQLQGRTGVNGSARLAAAGPLALPAELQAAGARVVAFSGMPQHITHARSIGQVPENRYGPDGFYWADDLKQAYDFPSYQVLTGRGRTIAIVMASDFLDADMAAYFGHEKLAVPKFERIPVCVTFSNPPTPPVTECGAPWNVNSGASFEVTLDLQQSGGMAPKAHIQLYNIPDLSDQSILTAYQQIIDANQADIVSSSFGEAESFYLASYNGGEDFTYILQQYDDLFRQGNAQGITFVASSGDSGGLALPSVNYFYPDGNPVTFLPGAETPAVSPHVTAVGGTNLVTASTTGSLNSAYVKENANGDPEVPYDPYGVGQNVSGGYWGSGGGVSVVFQKPFYQFLANTGASMRAVPDISLQMGGCPAGISQLPCPLDGTDRSASILAFAFGTANQGYYGVIGTSISAPGFAGTLALWEEFLGGRRLGNVNYLLYGIGAQGEGWGDSRFGGPFHRHITGFNGYEYSGGGGYNQVLGLGTPDVRRLMQAPWLPAAGNPQTPSNP